MAATLKLIREKYEGAEGYLTRHTNLTAKDIDEIRKGFLVPKSVAEDQMY